MRILIRASNWVGDAVLNLPALQAILRRFVGAEVIVLARELVAPIFDSIPELAGVIGYRGLRRAGSAPSDALGFWQAVKVLRGLRFTKAYLFQNAFEAALLCFLAGIPNRTGYSTDGRAFLLTKAIPVKVGRGVHHRDYYLNMLRAAGIDCASESLPKLNVAVRDQEEADEILAGLFGGEGPGFIAICPGATFGPAKRWPAASFAGVVDWVWEKTGLASVVLGSSYERRLTSSVCQQAKARCFDLGGRTTLMQAAGILRRARLAISNDSGLMHLAAAVGVPVLGIFTSTDPRATGPLGPGHRVLRASVPCSPCFRRSCRLNYECMSSITVEQVGKEVERMLAP